MNQFIIPNVNVLSDRREVFTPLAKGVWDWVNGSSFTRSQ
jgi:hypothetical protein